MKTKDAAHKAMSKMLVSGTPGFLFQYAHGGWSWSSEGSPNGARLKAALDKGSQTGTFLDSRGRHVAPFHNVERTQA